MVWAWRSCPIPICSTAVGRRSTCSDRSVEESSYDCVVACTRDAQTSPPRRRCDIASLPLAMLAGATMP